MLYHTSSLSANVEMFLVFTSSLDNGPIVEFSASFNATRSLVSGSFEWGVREQDILSIEKLTIVSSSISGSSVSDYIFNISESTYVDINNECVKIFNYSISSSNITDLFSSTGITLS